MTNGKGDVPRPKSVTEQDYAERWARTFRTTHSESQMPKPEIVRDECSAMVLPEWTHVRLTDAHGNVKPTVPMYSYLSRRQFTMDDATALRDYVSLFRSTHHGPEDERDRAVLDIADRIEAMSWK